MEAVRFLQEGPATQLTAIVVDKEGVCGRRDPRRWPNRATRSTAPMPRPIRQRRLRRFARTIDQGPFGADSPRRTVSPPPASRALPNHQLTPGGVTIMTGEEAIGGHGVGGAAGGNFDHDCAVRGPGSDHGTGEYAPKPRIGRANGRRWKEFGCT